MTDRSRRALSSHHLLTLGAVLGALAPAACSDDAGDTTSSSSASGSTGTGTGTGTGTSSGGGGGEGGAGTTGTGGGGGAATTGAGGAGGATTGAGGSGGGATTGAGGGGGGAACDDGQIACGDACVDDVLSCGVAIPEGCDDAAQCGDVATCVGARCVCTDGFRACAMGCCPAAWDETTLADVVAEDARLAHGPDGTAYLALAVREPGLFARDLHLYTRSPGGVLERADLTITDLAATDRAFDLVVRDDGVVFVAHALGSSSDVHLVTWSPGDEAETEPMGNTNAGRPGVSLDVDGEDTVWASFTSPQNTFQVYGFALEADGTRRTFVRSASGRPEQTVVRARSTGDVYAFYGHRYTGSFATGAVAFTDSEALSPTCPVDDARLGPGDVLWSVFNSYSSIRTHVCRDGVSIELRDAAIEGGFPSAVNHPRIAVDGEGIAHVVAYQPADYEATWLSSADGVAWSRVELPIDYGNPSGELSPGQARVAIATGPDGRVSIAVVPVEVGMGLLRLFAVE